MPGNGSYKQLMARETRNRNPLTVHTWVTVAGGNISRGAGLDIR